MVKHTTPKEVNTAKWGRMKRIKEALKTKSLSLSDVEKAAYGPNITPVGRRAVQTYIAELLALGDVERNEPSGLYSLVENKRVFQTKNDYELALKHSGNVLLLKVRDLQLSTYFYEPNMLEKLSFWEDDYVTNKAEDNPFIGSDVYFAESYLLQHIKTGYPELQKMMEEYKLAALKEGLTSGVHYTRLCGNDDLDRAEEIRKQKIQKAEKKLMYLSDLFSGRLSRIIRAVKDGTPLLGSCEACPSRKITIKDA